MSESAENLLICGFFYSVYSIIVFIYGVQVADLGTIANSESYVEQFSKTFTAAEEKYYPSQQILVRAATVACKSMQYPIFFLRLVQRTNDIFIHFTAEFGAYEISTSILISALFSIYYGIQAHKDRAICELLVASHVLKLYST